MPQQELPFRYFSGMANKRKTGWVRPEREEKLRRALSKRQPSLTVVLEDIEDVHNLSAAMRSCDATGVLQMHTIYNKKKSPKRLGKRSSAGARKWVEIQQHESAKECFEQLRNDGFRIYTTHLDTESESLYELDLTQPVALVFGNESEGVSQEALDLADGNFLIPQTGMAQSLNISVAVAVSVFEAYRQRMEAGMYDKLQMTEAEYLRLLEEWKRK